MRAAAGDRCCHRGLRSCSGPLLAAGQRCVAPQLCRAGGSTPSALYLEVFLAEGLHLCSKNACEDVLVCTKETGGKEEKPRTVKLYFCF